VNGGPGSDSLIGLFVELGPCKILTKDLKVQFNPYSFTNVSNVLFLSQPYGTGFSYEKKAPGTRNTELQVYEPPSFGGVDGRYPVVFEEFLTSDVAAAAAWDVLQTFYRALPQLDPKIKSRLFNLYTESYGGIYGPIVYALGEKFSMSP
jgi:carboxypeptidase C (cathepsin A)